jgi:hypothetical protein
VSKAKYSLGKNNWQKSAEDSCVKKQQEMRREAKQLVNFAIEGEIF